MTTEQNKSPPQRTEKQINQLRAQYGIDETFIPVASAGGALAWITKDARIMSLETSNAELLEDLEILEQLAGRGPDYDAQLTCAKASARAAIAKARR
jgi:hypothetical protein